MTSDSPPANRLIRESSPYLLQHAFNPVDWHPWGDEALEKAAKENKPLLISIGYAACHWCHVMEKESFEDAEVAAVMNRHFVCIKIDREERPDLDQVYMSAVQLLNGQGGWPLHCFALPDGKPFWGATYFPKHQWLQVLEQMHQVFSTRRKEAEMQAAELTEGINSGISLLSPFFSEPFSSDHCNQYLDTLSHDLDHVSGGLRSAPKFPVACVWHLLLMPSEKAGNASLRTALLTTLSKMYRGGLYDHAGGGFARYATDMNWKIPHFEKMLYDNALLAALYSDAFRKTHDPLFINIAAETLAFMKRELGGTADNFHSSLDADSPEGEGAFYTWTEEEIRAAVEAGADDCIRWFSVGAEGLWENGRSILIAGNDAPEFAAALGITANEFHENVAQWKKQLLAARSLRPRPSTDDKSLAAWNALAAYAFAAYWKATGNEEARKTAIKTGRFIRSMMTGADGTFFHAWKNGKAYIPAFLDDHAYAAAAFLALYEITFDHAWISAAQEHCDFVMQHFADPASSLFFYTSDLQPAVVARTKEIADTVTPSGNAVMAMNFFRLGTITGNSQYTGSALRMLGEVFETALRHPASFAHWAELLHLAAHPCYTLEAPAGTTAEDLAAAFRPYYFPQLFFTGTGNGNAYRLCSRTECFAPVATASEAIEQLLQNEKHYSQRFAP